MEKYKQKFSITSHKELADLDAWERCEEEEERWDERWDDID